MRKSERAHWMGHGLDGSPRGGGGGGAGGGAQPWPKENDVQHDRNQSKRGKRER